MQVEGANYLIPIGSDITHEDEVPYSGVNADIVLSKMESARNGLNIVILDACRNNPFKRRFKSSFRGLARADVPVGTVLAYSTAPGGVADDGDPNEQGLFTRYLLQHMKTPNIGINDVLLRTRRDVFKASGGRQLPWESNSLISRFCFAGCDVPSNSEPRVVTKTVYKEVPKVVYKDRVVYKTMYKDPNTGEVISDAPKSSDDSNCHSHTSSVLTNTTRHCHANPSGIHSR